MAKGFVIKSSQQAHAILAGRKTRLCQLVGTLVKIGAVLEINPCEKFSDRFDWEITDTNYRTWRYRNDQLLKHCTIASQIGEELFMREPVWVWCEKIPTGKVTVQNQPIYEFYPVRESPMIYAYDYQYEPEFNPFDSTSERLHYCAWRKMSPSMMQEWMSRVTMKVTGIKMKKLSELTEEDYDKMGVTLEDYEVPIIGKKHKFLQDFCAENADRKLIIEKDALCWIIDFTVYKKNQENMIDLFKIKNFDRDVLSSETLTKMQSWSVKKL